MRPKSKKIVICVVGAVVLATVALACLITTRQRPLSKEDVIQLGQALNLKIPSSAKLVRTYIIEHWDSGPHQGIPSLYVRLEFDAADLPGLEADSWIGSGTVSLRDSISDFEIGEVGPPWFDAAPARQNDVVHQDSGAKIRVLVRKVGPRAILYFASEYRDDLPDELYKALTRYSYSDPPILGPVSRYVRQWP